MVVLGAPKARKWTKIKTEAWLLLCTSSCCVPEGVYLEGIAIYVGLFDLSLGIARGVGPAFREKERSGK